MLDGEILQVWLCERVIATLSPGRKYPPGKLPFQERTHDVIVDFHGIRQEESDGDFRTWI